jgi:hypothetical protein
LVEICALPLKTFDRTITQYDKVWIAVLRHPSLVCGGSAMRWLPMLGWLVWSLHRSDCPPCLPAMVGEALNVCAKRSYTQRKQIGKTPSLSYSTPRFTRLNCGFFTRCRAITSNHGVLEVLRVVASCKRELIGTNDTFEASTSDSRGILCCVEPLTSG